MYKINLASIIAICFSIICCIEKKQYESNISWTPKPTIQDQVSYLDKNNEKYSDDIDTALFQALHYDNIQKMNEVLKNGANINARAPAGSETPLIMAINRNKKEIAIFLIKKGANVNIADRDKNTPLMFAVSKSDLEVVNLLIKAGADVNIKDANDKTALIYALYNNKYDIIKLLLEHNADVNFLFYDRDSIYNEGDQKTALQLAREKGFKEIKELLLKYGAE